MATWFVSLHTNQVQVQMQFVPKQLAGVKETNRVESLLRTKQLLGQRYQITAFDARVKVTALGRHPAPPSMLKVCN